MEILIYIMLLCYDNGGTCSYPTGIQSSTFSDRETCEHYTELMNKNYRVMVNNSALERSRLYASCFAKTATGWASTVPDKAEQERRLAARGRDILPEPVAKTRSNFDNYIDQLNDHRRRLGMTIPYASVEEAVCDPDAPSTSYALMKCFDAEPDLNETGED